MSIKITKCSMDISFCRFNCEKLAWFGLDSKVITTPFRQGFFCHPRNREAYLLNPQKPAYIESSNAITEMLTDIIIHSNLSILMVVGFPNSVAGAKHSNRRENTHRSAEYYMRYRQRQKLDGLSNTMLLIRSRASNYCGLQFEGQHCKC